MRGGAHGGLALVVVGMFLAAGCGEGDGEPEAALRASPAAVAFGSTGLDVPVRRTVTVTNAGQAAATLERASVAGDGLEAFALETEAPAGHVLPPGGTLDLDLVFVPPVPGRAEATLVVAAGADRLQVALAGEGLVPALRVDAAELDLGMVPVGGETSAAVGIELEGEVPALLRPPPVSGADAEAFVPEGEARLLDGSTEWSVTFRPARAGAHEAVLTFSACGGCPEVPVAVRGEGMAAPLHVIEPGLDFGAVTPGKTVERALHLRNVSNGPVRLTAAAVETVVAGAPFEPAFTLPADLAPGAEAVLPYAWQAPEDGASAVRVRFGCDVDPCADAEPILEARAGGPELVAPAAMDFGDHYVGATVARTLTLANAGIEPLVLEGVAAGSGWTVVDPAPERVPAGGEAALTVAFSPDAAGPWEGALALSTGDADAPVVNVALTGRAHPRAPCALEVSPAELDFAHLPVGETFTRRLTVRNPGTATCLFEGATLEGPFHPTPFHSDGPGRTLGPGEAATVAVTARPEVATWVGATLTLSGDPELMTPIVVPLQVTGYEGGAWAWPRRVAFEPAPARCALTRVICAPGSSGLEIVEGGQAFELVGETALDGCWAVRLVPDTEGEAHGLVRATFEEADVQWVALHGDTAPERVTSVVVGRQRDVLIVAEASSTFLQRTPSDFTFEDGLSQALTAAGAAHGLDYRIGVTWSDTPYPAGLHSTDGLFFATPALPTPATTLFELLTAWPPLNDTEGSLATALEYLGPGVERSSPPMLRSGVPLSVLFVIEEPEQVLDLLTAGSEELMLRYLRQGGGAGAPLAGVSVLSHYIGAVREERLAAATGGAAWRQYLPGEGEAVDNPEPMSAGLARVAEAVFAAPHAVFLPDAVDPDAPLAVTVVGTDGTPRTATGWTYDPARRAIVFEAESAPQVNETVEVRHRPLCGFEEKLPPSPYETPAG